MCIHTHMDTYTDSPGRPLPFLDGSDVSHSTSHRNSLSDLRLAELLENPCEVDSEPSSDDQGGQSCGLDEESCTVNQGRSPVCASAESQSFELHQETCAVVAECQAFEDRSLVCQQALDAAESNLPCEHSRVTAAVVGQAHETAAVVGQAHETAAVVGQAHETAAVVGQAHETDANIVLCGVDETVRTDTTQARSHTSDTAAARCPDKFPPPVCGPPPSDPGSVSQDSEPEQDDSLRGLASSASFMSSLSLTGSLSLTDTHNLTVSESESESLPASRQIEGAAHKHISSAGMPVDVEKGMHLNAHATAECHVESVGGASNVPFTDVCHDISEGLDDDSEVVKSPSEWVTMSAVVSGRIILTSKVMVFVPEKQGECAGEMTSEPDALRHIMKKRKTWQV
jgi:hypothetical protein